MQTHAKANNLIIHYPNLAKRRVLDSGRDFFSGCANNDLCDLECIDFSLFVPISILCPLLMCMSGIVPWEADFYRPRLACLLVSPKEGTHRREFE